MHALRLVVAGAVRHTAAGSRRHINCYLLYTSHPSSAACLREDACAGTAPEQEGGGCHSHHAVRELALPVLVQRGKGNVGSTVPFSCRAAPHRHDGTMAFMRLPQASLPQQRTATTSAKRCTGAVRDWAASTSRTMSATAASQWWAAQTAVMAGGRVQRPGVAVLGRAIVAVSPFGKQQACQACKSHLCRRRCAPPAR